MLDCTWLSRLAQCLVSCRQTGIQQAPDQLSVGVRLLVQEFTLHSAQLCRGAREYSLALVNSWNLAKSCMSLKFLKEMIFMDLVGVVHSSGSSSNGPSY